VKITRTTKAAALAAVGIAMLAACSEGGSTDSASSSTAAIADCASGTLSAEGSSAQNNAMVEWIKQYQTACPDATVNYNPTGSGAGIQQFIAGQVDFAGSDSALKEDEGEVKSAKERCEGNDAWNLPMVVGPIAVAYNLEGVDALVLDADVIAKIFSGEIKKWNDEAIAALNTDATLPDADITVFYRSDESGTTENFTKYMAAAAPKVWTEEPSKTWTGTGEGKEKSSGVQEATIQNPNSITYVEWSYARDGNLGVAEVDNGSGPVTLSGESAGKALEAAKITGTGNDLRMELDYATQEAGTYPIVLVTYEIACSKGLAEDKAMLVKSFLTYTASEDGQGVLDALGYAALPSSVDQKVQTAVAALQ
jgi:phosphate transport system substrate-binding protein